MPTPNNPYGFYVNGRLRPYIRGAATDETGAEPPAPETPPAEPETSAPEPSAPETPPPAAEQETFDRSYVEKLRQEAADYRTKYATYRDAFDGYADDDRDAILGLARELVSDPKAAARRMLDASRNLAGDEFDAWLSNEEPKPLTADEMDKRLEERDAAKKQQEALDSVINEAKGLGYEEGTAGYADLMYRAYNEFEGDLSKANEARESEKQAVIDAYLAEKQGDASKFHPVTTDGTPSSSGEAPPKTFKEAGVALRAFLDTKGAQTTPG